MSRNLLFLSINIPIAPSKEAQNENATDGLCPVKIIIDEIDRTITVEGDPLPPSTTIDDVKANVEQALKDNGIIFYPDFDFVVKIPGYDDNADLTPTPY